VTTAVEIFLCRQTALGEISPAWPGGKGKLRWLLVLLSWSDERSEDDTVNGRGESVLSSGATHAAKEEEIIVDIEKLFQRTILLYLGFSSSCEQRRYILSLSIFS
jgi:hypothetical protein